MTETAATPVIADAEQSLCVQCGLCCDGTIFESARVFAEDDLARLEANGFIIQLATPAQRAFALPCHHHQDRVCTVYQQWRPQVCHTFRCALLRRFAAGELTWDEARVQIARAVALAERIQTQLPPPPAGTRQTLKARLAAWQHVQQAAGVDVPRSFAPLLLDFASLQRLLNRYFRLKQEKQPPVEKPAPATEPLTTMAGGEHA